MATAQHLLLSPAELAYLHSSLSLTPPIRPDGRSATQFRPLTAETGVLPGTNGSARICFADGTEAIVGAKAEVERTRPSLYKDQQQQQSSNPSQDRRRRGEAGQQDGKTQEEEEDEARGSNEWLDISVEIPGYRDDDSPTVFLSTMLREALLADGGFTRRLRINRRFHWKLYLDIILLSPPLSYPLPLLSLTTHLALLSTRLPRLRSEADEDPMFDDDWATSTFLYPPSSSGRGRGRPPITLLVMTAGGNILFDPSKEELAVADSALAVSVGGEASTPKQDDAAMDVDDDNDNDSAAAAASTRSLRLLSVRTIDPPSRLTPPGVPNTVNAAAWGQQQQQQQQQSAGGLAAAAAKNPDARAAETDDVAGVWKAPRGGMKPAVLAAMVAKVLEKGGIADEVLDGLEGVELG